MADWPAAMWIDAAPASGSTLAVPVGDARVPVRLSINNAALLAAVTLSWPVANVADGQLVAINCQSAITLLTHTVPGGTMRGGAVALLAGANGIYVFRLANLTWYKFS